MLSALLSRLRVRVPSLCAVCRRWPAEPLCQDCSGRFARPRPRCRRCALPVPPEVAECGNCLRRPPPLAAFLAAVDYGYPWAGCIASFKFHGEPGWTGPLARVMAGAPGAGAALREADLVLPIPLSRARLRQRGFNQAWELARRLAPRRADAALLLRTRDTPLQHALDRATRLSNLADAFVPDPLRNRRLHGARVLLIDDVMTTGATLYAAALSLRQAGAAAVAGLVLARTEEVRR